MAPTVPFDLSPFPDRNLNRDLFLRRLLLIASFVVFPWKALINPRFEKLYFVEGKRIVFIAIGKRRHFQILQLITHHPDEVAVCRATDDGDSPSRTDVL